jgi:hypothetical protein
MPCWKGKEWTTGSSLHCDSRFRRTLTSAAEIRRNLVLQKQQPWRASDSPKRQVSETKYLSSLETGWRSPAFEKTVALAKALDIPIGDLFSFEHEEADPKILKRRIETILAKATAQQLKQIYGHVRQVM